MKAILKTKKIVILMIINTLMLLLIGCLFSGAINASYQSYVVWNNCESGYVAYNQVVFEKNCYYYYGKQVAVKLNSGDSVKLNVDVYQFIPYMQYDNGSLLNEKNIILGEYYLLQDFELAVPKMIAEKYNLVIGDKLYVNNDISYEIKFIFENLYNIKNPSIDSSEAVIFVGGDNILNKDYVYAGFGVESGVYNEIYTFDRAKYSFILTMIINLFLVFLFCLFTQISIFIFIRKSEMSNLYKDCVSGSKKKYNRSLFGVNCLLHFIPLLIASIVLALMKNVISGISIFCTTLIFLIIKVIYLKVKIH